MLISVCASICEMLQVSADMIALIEGLPPFDGTAAMRDTRSATGLYKKHFYFQATGQATTTPELRCMRGKIQKLEFTDIEHNIQGFGD